MHCRSHNPEAKLGWQKREELSSSPAQCPLCIQDNHTYSSLGPSCAEWPSAPSWAECTVSTAYMLSLHCCPFFHPYSLATALQGNRGV